jgi:WD40 repeat protein
MKIWNIFTGECENTWKIDSSYPLPMTLFQKNTRLLCASSSANNNNGPLLRIWNLFTGECERVFQQHAWIFTKLTATGDDDENDDRLAMVYEDMSIHIFNSITSSSMIMDEKEDDDDEDGDNDEIVLNRNGFDVLLLFQLQDGRLVSAHNDNAIRIWNLQTKKYDQILHGHEDAPTVMIQLTATSPHPYPRHRCLVTGSKDKTVKIWNIDTGSCEWTLKGHTNGIHSLIEFSSPGNNNHHHRLLSGDWDMSVKIWNLLTGECERTFDRCINYIANLLKIDERRFACGGSSSSSDGDDSNCIKIWNIETGECDGSLSGHSQSIKNLLRLNDGRLVSSSMDTTIKIWS